MQFDPSSEFERINVFELFFRRPVLALRVIKSRLVYRFKYGRWKTYYK